MKSRMTDQKLTGLPTGFWAVISTDFRAGVHGKLDIGLEAGVNSISMASLQQNLKDRTYANKDGCVHVEYRDPFDGLTQLRGPW